MWLINVYTLKLVNVLSHDVADTHPYAILSHTWDEQEVSFQEMQNSNKARHKARFWKIAKTCEQAKEDGLHWAWVDTCCIDKTSSAELQEAINSMKWSYYRYAAKCYAYLRDVNVDSSSKQETNSQIQKSRWFTRGWTLQELIAPDDVHFHGRQWKFVGSRSEHAALISRQTGIDIAILRGTRIVDFPFWPDNPETDPRYLGHFSVAQIFSWAASRTTTRVEDRAYSLLGFFRVSMPLLYGEGSNAFIRLQEEILRMNPDLSVLLWEKSEEQDLETNLDDRILTLFATSPAAFRNCGSIIYRKGEKWTESSVDRTVSLMGIRMRVPILPVHVSDHEKADYAAVLGCYDAEDTTSVVALKLVTCRNVNLDTSTPTEPKDPTEPAYLDPYSARDITAFGAQTRTMRIDAIEAEERCAMREVVLVRDHLRQPQDLNLAMRKQEEFWIWVRFATRKREWTVLDVFPSTGWNRDRLTFQLSGTWYMYESVIAVVLQKNTMEESRVIVTIGATESKWTRRLFFNIEKLEHGIEVDLSKVCGHPSAGFDSAAKSVQLYEGTRVYDGLILSGISQVREVGGRSVGIVHIRELQSLQELEDTA